MTINITGIPKNKLLAALFNASQQQGMGFMDATGASEMSEDEASTILDGHGDGRFDYLRGRVMKIDISGDEANPALYDRDNGAGACAAAIDSIR